MVDLDSTEMELRTQGRAWSDEEFVTIPFQGNNKLPMSTRIHIGRWGPAPHAGREGVIREARTAPAALSLSLPLPLSLDLALSLFSHSPAAVRS
jgi:hypothetical protein